MAKALKYIREKDSIPFIPFIPFMNIAGMLVEKGRVEGRTEGEEKVIVKLLNSGLDPEYVATGTEFPMQRILSIQLKMESERPTESL